MCKMQTNTISDHKLHRAPLTGTLRYLVACRLRAAQFSKTGLIFTSLIHQIGNGTDTILIKWISISPDMTGPHYTLFVSVIKSCIHWVMPPPRKMIPLSYIQWVMQILNVEEEITVSAQHSVSESAKHAILRGLVLQSVMGNVPGICCELDKGYKGKL